MDNFAVNPKSLRHLLARIHERELGLPDFQRDFVWQARDTEGLVESISREFPAGALLFMAFKPNTFTPRAVQNAPALVEAPLELILDGQQRLTSLYQAFYGEGDYRYFIDLKALRGEHADIEEAVFVRHKKRVKRLENLDAQASELVFPLSALFGGGGFEAWFDRVMDQRTETGADRDALRIEIRGAHERFIKPIETYQFPVITLAHDVGLEAVCSIFETLNKTGVKLSVFDLLAARFFAEGLDLRAKWLKARDERPILATYFLSEYYVLQAIALRVRRSVARGEVLRLTRSDIEEHWDPVTRGFEKALEMLRNECGVLSEKWLPYAYMLVPMAALWDQSVERAGPASGAHRRQFKQWFWCSALNARYDRAANTQAAKDFAELRVWISGGDAPQSVQDFAFDRARLRDITPKAQSVYKALMALILRRPALDFHHAQPINPLLVSEQQVDDHHIFPQAYLNPTGSPAQVPVEQVNCILNRTLIDRDTNIRIGKRAPSDYLGEIQSELEVPSAVGEGAFRRLLESHLLSPAEDSPLMRDEFPQFLMLRGEALIAEIEEATGCPVIGDPGTISDELDAVV